MNALYLAASGRGEAPPPGAAVLCFSWEAAERVRRAGGAIQGWEDMLPASDAPELMRRTFALADEWHRDSAGDLTEFRGFSLGRLFRWLAWIFTLHPAFKFAASLARAVEEHRPQVVTCEDSVPVLYRAVLAQAAGPLGFRVETIPTGDAPSDPNAWSLPTLSAPLWKRLGARVLNAAASPSSRRRPEWLLSYYHSLESVVAAARAGGAAVSFADIPPARRMPSLLGKAGVWLDAAAPEALDAADSAALADIAQRWDRLRTSPEHASRWLWKGIDLRPVVEPALDDLVRARFRPWAWACRRVDERWSRNPPARLLLPFPGPPYQQVLQMAARKHRTPWAVLLHGLTFDYGFPFEHPEGGRFLVWGPEMETLYAPHTADRFATAAVGNPYLDRYAGRNRKRAGPIRRVLLLSHPEIRSTALSSSLDPARHVLAAVKAFARVPELEFTVRLHPSESIPYYKHLVANAAQRARVVKGGPTDASLEEHDLVIGSFSTVLLEALLLGLPVAALNVTRDVFPPPFDGNWGVPLLTSEEALEALLRRAVNDPDGLRRSLDARREEIISRFAGRIDRNTAASVVQELTLC